MRDSTGSRVGVPYCDPCEVFGHSAAAGTCPRFDAHGCNVCGHMWWAEGCCGPCPECGDLEASLAQDAIEDPSAWEPA